MARYLVTAVVNVDVGIRIEAANAAEARKIFEDKIAMTASIVDVPADSFAVEDDSISDIECVEVYET